MGIRQIILRFRRIVRCWQRYWARLLIFREAAQRDAPKESREKKPTPMDKISALSLIKRMQTNAQMQTATIVPPSLIIMYLSAVSLQPSK